MIPSGRLDRDDPKRFQAWMFAQQSLPLAMQIFSRSDHRRDLHSRRGT